MSAVVDMVGQRYARLVVLERAESSARSRACWLCQCDCGKRVVVVGKNLRTGNSESCGCLRRERALMTNTLHGGHGSAEYRAWQNMLNRCRNSNRPDWKNYGGRGIRVCEQWVESFEAFLTYIGSKPGPEYTVERIDNDGNYEPGNVRWATRKEQTANRRKQVKREPDGL